MIPLHASLSLETLQAKLEASCALPAIRVTPAVLRALEWAARYRLPDADPYVVKLGELTPKLPTVPEVGP